jgi:hypothetical protein
VSHLSIVDAGQITAHPDQAAQDGYALLPDLESLRGSLPISRIATTRPS